MATIQVKNLPDEAVRTLKVRAAKSGQSLQEYMRAYLIEVTARPTRQELLERLATRSGGSFEFTEAARLVREDRDSH
ncbi:MAG: hypothetical protein HZB14_01400 [Actinobacteria bacterium]|nr:hypothetical protein [Actinomycetota bacterium]